MNILGIFRFLILSTETVEIDSTRNTANIALVGNSGVAGVELVAVAGIEVGVGVGAEVPIGVGVGPEYVM